MCMGIRECFGSKPPMAVFSVSIVGFALTLVGVSLYLQSHKSQILNPDIKDWNSFFTTLSDMEICFPSHSTTTEKSRMKRELPPPTTTMAVTKANETEANKTLSILADVQVEKDGISMEGITIHTFIGSKFLGFKRDPSRLEVTIDLSKQVSKNWTACITLSGPEHLLPDSPQSPLTCTPNKDPVSEEVQMAQPWLVLESDEWCLVGAVASLSVAPQHELNVYLSNEDVTLIQVHILYTTSLLCVMMMGLLFYFCCGRRCSTRIKAVPAADKVPLHA